MSVQLPCRRRNISFGGPHQELHQQQGLQGFMAHHLKYVSAKFAKQKYL